MNYLHIIQQVEFVGSREFTFFVIPAPHGMRDKLQSESSNFSKFWMPVEYPVFSGDQVRHDGFGTFYETVKIILDAI
jgi:hypothetical protein